MSDDKAVRRIIPQNSLDWQAMTTDTMWGSPQISLQLKNRIEERSANESEKREDAWELLSFYTRDFRLANLSTMWGEVDFCQYYIDLGGDLLREGFSESFATALSRSATRLELSQSKGGFLRRRQNTITSEHFTSDMDKKKKLLFGGKAQ